jgi:cyclopropane-fatty-acyl-phospholipid synthase
MSLKGSKSRMSIAHPLVVPIPRLPGADVAARRFALRGLGRRWAAGRLDLALPNGELVRLGDAGPSDATVVVHDERLFTRLLVRGELGAGEGYIAGEWSSPDLVGAVRAFLRGTQARGAESALTWLGRLPELVRHKVAANSRRGSERNIHAHYDLGNAFYQLMLDEETLAYSAGRWRREGESLGEAQRAKLDRLADLLALAPSDHLLEVGCGGGGMAIHAAQTRGCQVTAITVSREQHELARARVAAAGLADRVDVQYRDYRSVVGSYDKVVSIEMVEAVGHEFLPAYFAACARALRPGGRMALQAITIPDDRYEAYRRGVDWMQTYIFPGSLIPSLGALRAASAEAGLAWTSAEDVGLDYVPTLRAWRDRFTAQLPAVRALGFDAPFIRTWQLYLAFSEAAFSERTLGVHHVVLER